MYAALRCGGRTLDSYHDSAHLLAPACLTRMLRTTGAIILMIAYGYPLEENDDPYLRVAEASMSGFSEVVVPGAFLVDVIPSCKLRSLLSCATGNTNHGYRFLTLIHSTPNPSAILTLSSPLFVRLLHPPLLPDSAICP